MVGPDCQDGVEQKHSLPGPSLKVAGLRYSYAKITVQFLKDVDKAGREFGSVGNGKTQTVGLSDVVIGILSDYDNLHPVKRTQVKSVEDQVARRKDTGGCILLPYKIGQGDKILFPEFIPELLFPACFDLYFHSIDLC